MIESTLGLVVVGYDSDEVWPDFFEALDASETKPSAVVVVENSPLKPTTIPRHTGMQIDIVHLPDNPGYGSAVNEAVRRLAPSIGFIAIANADTVVHPQALAVLLREAQALSSAGALGPAVYDQKGKLYPSARAIPRLGIGIGHALLGALWKSNPWTQKYLGDYSGSHSRAVGWLSGSFLLVRRSSFESVGGFDAHYFMFFEDVDLCFRMKQQGWDSVYVPEASVQHVGGHSTTPKMVEMVTAHHVSAQRFFRTLYPQPAYAPVRFAVSLGLKLRSVIAERYYSLRARRR